MVSSRLFQRQQSNDLCPCLLVACFCCFSEWPQVILCQRSDSKWQMCKSYVFLTLYVWKIIHNSVHVTIQGVNSKSTPQRNERKSCHSFAVLCSKILIEKGWGEFSSVYLLLCQHWNGWDVICNGENLVIFPAGKPLLQFTNTKTLFRKVRVNTKTTSLIESVWATPSGNIYTWVAFSPQTGFLAFFYVICCPLMTILLGLHSQTTHNHPTFKMTVWKKWSGKLLIWWNLHHTKALRRTRTWNRMFWFPWPLSQQQLWWHALSYP